MIFDKKIEKEIELMYQLEDYVLKKIKYPTGDQTAVLKRYETLMVNLQEPIDGNRTESTSLKPVFSEYRYEITEFDKNYIYQMHALNENVGILAINSNKKILSEIKQFFSYVQSQSNITLEQVITLRKKALQTYAAHYDSLYLESFPVPLQSILMKIRNGDKKKISDNIIKQSFLKYAEDILLDEKETIKINYIDKNIIIDYLEQNSIPFVKEALIFHLEEKVQLLNQAIIRINILKESLLVPGDQFSDAVFIFNHDDEFKKSKRQYSKRISNYQRKIVALKEEKKGVTKKDVLRKKFTGDSHTWLKNHEIQGKSLSKRIDEIVKRNRKHSYIKK